MDRALFKKTFSRLRASDKAKREVLTLIEEKTTEKRRRAFRLGRAVIVAAALLSILTLSAYAANEATDGELFRELAVFFTGESGEKLGVADVIPTIYRQDDRLILFIPDGEQELDITDELAADGSYLYEEGGFSVDVTVENGQWRIRSDFGDVTMELWKPEDGA